MKENITFQFQYTKKDIFRFYSTYLSRTFIKWPLLLLGLPILIVNSVYIFSGYIDYNLIIGLILGILMVFTRVTALILTLASSQTKHLFKKFTAVINDESVTLSTDLSIVERKWPLFSHYLTDKYGILLFVAPALTVYFPKRVFTSEQLEQLESILRKRIKLQPLFKKTFKFFLLLWSLLIVFPLLIDLVAIFGFFAQWSYFWFTL